MSRLAGLRHFGASLFGVALLVLAAAPPAATQTTTGTIRGYVRDSSGAPLAGAMVEAKNVATGGVRTATSNEDGSYVVAGLAPAVYDLTVRHIGSAPSTRRVVVQIGATTLADFTPTTQAVEVAGVNIQAAAPTFDLKTSEVATNISTQQMQQLPTQSRNFLDFAQLAPGVQVTEDIITVGNGVNTRTVSAGGGSPNQINVFIDGASMKNDLTGGGIAGQDASRGNPFPQNAIQEYRVISQNFKAEYQQAGTAIINATTKSGTNEWHGTAQFQYSDKGLFALDSFQIAQKLPKPDFSRALPSLSVGGPLMRDKLFMFASYEGNYQDRSNLINFSPISGFPALDSVNLKQYNGLFTSPFRETLLFGRLDYNAGEHSTVQASWSQRIEHDIRDFGTDNFGNGTAYDNAVNLKNTDGIGNLKYTYSTGPWLSETQGTYEDLERNPGPNFPGSIARQYFYFAAGTNNLLNNMIGSNLSIQDYTQKRFALRSDVTYTGFHGMGDHVFKAGVTLAHLKYDILKENNVTPQFLYTDSVQTNCWCRTRDTTSGFHAFDFSQPYQLSYGTGLAGLNTNNNQIGAYLQDDWSPTSRLTLNLGIRWDYESGMINTGYVTPQIVVDTLTRYNDSLPTPLDLNRYVANGHNRSAFKGAFQPRVGFSYAMDKDSKTTLFGGAGLYYDRSIFDFSIDEAQRLTHPVYTVRFAAPGQAPTAGQAAWSNSYLTTDTTVLNALVHSSGLPEPYLLDNNIKPPKYTQWSLGVRHMMGSWLGTLTYEGTRGVDLFTYNWANIGLNPNGSCCKSFNISAHGFNNFIYSTEDGKTWYDAVTLEFQRPYQRSASGLGWSAGIAFTYAKREVAGVDNLNDIGSSFPGGFPNALSIPKHPSDGGQDERQRLVGNWVVDLPYLSGFQFSGLVTLGSGPTTDAGCPPRFCGAATFLYGGFTPPPQNSIIPGSWAYQRVDVRLRKNFPEFSGMNLGVTLDVYNLFNTVNLGCWAVGYNPPNISSSAGCTASDPRRVQIGAQYDF